MDTFSSSCKKHDHLIHIFTSKTPSDLHQASHMHWADCSWAAALNLKVNCDWAVNFGVEEKQFFYLKNINGSSAYTLLMVESRMTLKRDGPVLRNG